MRRLGRWMLNALTALSLLLCVGTCVFWYDSYRHVDFVSRHLARSDAGRTIRTAEVTFRSGQVQLWVDRDKWEGVPSFTDPYWAVGRDGANNIDSFEFPLPLDVSAWAIGHRVERFEGSSHFSVGWIKHHDRQDVFFAPALIPWSALALLPGIRLFTSIRRRRRLVRGSCPHCSYDLHGNVSGVCPECGRKMAAAK